MRVSSTSTKLHHDQIKTAEPKIQGRTSLTPGKDQEIWSQLSAETHTVFS